MNFRNISAWSIRNPIIPIVFFIGLTIAGIISFNRLAVVNTPDIEFPAVTVNIAEPGAAPTEIETQITQRVESAIRSINGVDSIQSTASEGSSTTAVNFTIGTDVNDAVNEVKNAVDQIRGDLPDGILEPRVSKVEVNGGGTVGLYAVNAPDMTLEQLSWFVDDTVARQLLSVEGMAQISRRGGVDREIRVTLDPQRMQSLGLTARDVNSVLRQMNLNAAGGRAEIAGSRQSVRVLGNAKDAYQLSQARIPIGAGRTVQLSDIATVTDGNSERTHISRVAGKEAVTFSMARAKGVSEVSVYDDAQKVMKRIEKENPGVKFTELFTPVHYTKEQYDSSIAALIEGAVLAIVVVFFFLRDWRATIISAIAIPLSAIPTFWFMDLLGFNLNFLSLLALSLVAGVLVDDAIVEIENIVRHMRMGKSAYRASIDAADEIGLAVVATTASIVAVFLPVGLMPGISGEFFKPFGLTVVVAVLMSLLVARLITPMIAAYFLEAHGNAEHGEGRAMDIYMRVLAWTLDDRQSKAMRTRIERVSGRWYYYPFVAVLVVALIAATIWFGVKLGTLLSGAGLPLLLVALVTPILAAIGGVLLGKLVSLLIGWLGRFGAYYRSFCARFAARSRDHRFWAFCAGVYALIITGALLAGLPQQFQPTTDQDTSTINIELVPGTTIEQTSAAADRVKQLIRNQPQVKLVTETVREGSATLYIDLVPPADRKETSTDFERRLGPKLGAFPDARVSFASQNGGFGTGRDISVMLSGSNTAQLNKTAQTLADQMHSIKGVVAPRIASDLQRPELIIVPREDLASQFGVTTAALSSAIRIATLGEIDQNAAKFSLQDRQVPIRVMLPQNSRRDLSTIENLPVTTGSGGSVPLKLVADIRFGAGPTQIQRYNQARRVFVGADLGAGVVKGPIMDQIKQLPIMKNLPAGVSNEPVGEDKWQGEMINNFVIAVISGILLVFGVLVLLYRRFVSPLVNMTSLLLAPLGGLIALLIIGQPISMPVYIGILMLLGIVAKNSILLIDFALEEMQAGVEKRAAIMDAGNKRAQPIAMTTVAMTAGMVPTAISLAGDSAWRAPMGTVVIGGLLVSTLLTLVLIPAGFSLADGFEKRIGPWLRDRILTYRPGDDQAVEPYGRGETAPAE